MSARPVTYRTSELAHAWVHKTSPQGKCSANMSFAGPDFYSYGTVIAKRVTVGERTAYVLNTTTYSTSTHRHQSSVHRAIPDTEIVFDIATHKRGDYNERGRDLGVAIFEQAIARAAKYRETAKRQRANQQGISVACERDALEMARKASEFWGLRRKVDEKAIERLARQAAAAKAKAAREDKLAQIKREAARADDVQAWLAGTIDRFPYGIERVYLRRLTHDVTPGFGDPEPAQVETSRGAFIPLADAERAFRFALTVRERGWRRNGTTCPVGSYQLDSIGPDGIIAGCHRVSWLEVERFAGLMGWDKEGTQTMR